MIRHGAPNHVAVSSPNVSGQSHGGPARRERGDAPNMSVSAWAATGGLSVALLVLSLIVDERPGTLLAAMGFAGLAVFRLAAMSGGWLRRSSIRGVPTDRARG
jgi:small-conductance mechanosensitive channel